MNNTNETKIFKIEEKGYLHLLFLESRSVFRHIVDHAFPRCYAMQFYWGFIQKKKKIIFEMEMRLNNKNYILREHQETNAILYPILERFNTLDHH